MSNWLNVEMKRAILKLSGTVTDRRRQRSIISFSCDGTAVTRVGGRPMRATNNTFWFRLSFAFQSVGRCDISTVVSNYPPQFTPPAKSSAAPFETHKRAMKKNRRAHTRKISINSMELNLIIFSIVIVRSWS